MLGLTFALLIGVIVVIYNPQLIKAPLENYLSGVAGYPINLNGGLELKVGSKIEVIITGAKVSAPPWSRQPNLINLDYLKLVVAAGSLFEDTVILDSLQVDGLQLNLETGPDGSSNWTRVRPKPAKSIDGKNPTRVVFNSIQVTSTDLRYFSEKKSIEHDLHIAVLNQHQQDDGMLHIELEGDYEDKKINYSGSIGTYENLLKGSNVAYSGSGRFGLLKISGSGLIDDLIRPRHPQFSIKIEGPEIDKITTVFGFDDLGSGPLSLNAAGNKVNDHYEANVDGDIGDISISVSAQASSILELDDLDLKLGEYKIQLGKGPKLHNGIESIENKLNTKNFWRLRIGVDNRKEDNRIPGEAYVLQNFTANEQERINKVFEQISHELIDRF